MSVYDWMHIIREATDKIAGAIKYHGEMTVIASRLHESYEAEKAADAIIKKHV